MISGFIFYFIVPVLYVGTIFALSKNFTFFSLTVCAGVILISKMWSWFDFELLQKRTFGFMVSTILVYLCTGFYVALFMAGSP